MKELLIAIAAVLSMTACVANPSAPDSSSSGGGSTASANYDVSASGCTVGSYGSYSYQGGQSNTCYAYYNAAVAARCSRNSVEVQLTERVAAARPLASM